MSIFSSKDYKALAEQLSSELEEANQRLQLERARRLSAEAIAEERREQIEKAWAMVAEANKSRDEAVSERLKSIDLVNTTLLGVVTPEKPTTRDISEFRSVPKPPKLRSAIERYVDDHIRALKQKAVKQQPAQQQNVN
jgi:hypothetical protein